MARPPSIHPAGAGAESRQNLDALTARELRTRKPFLVALDPGRHVRGHTIFPGPEPKQDQLELVSARVLEQHVQGIPTEAALFRLDQFPAYRREHRVQVHLLEPRPVRRHVRLARCTRVPELTAEHQEWLAVHDQARGRALLLQPRRNRFRLERGHFIIM
jgi:hypothetical protein